jgi:para-nitrobenzyl esterase
MRALMGLLGLALAFSGVTAAQNASVIVPTESGLVQGVIEGDVRGFRGIPFAAPPVGDLRWRPPATPAQWSGIRDASTFGNVCPQLGNIFSGNFVGNEDCLVLNVYTAANLDPNAGQPVMVFFHGGGDVGGSTQDGPSGSAPPPLATHGVVVVTAEYRLGALGFFVHPLLAIEGHGSSGNYGLMDQIAALAWVQSNIRNFGGDPARVMAFGASSGAADVQALLTSPAAQGLFSRAGIESDAIPPNEAMSLETAEAFQAPLVALVGCSSAPDVLACLRAVPASVLVTNQFAVPIDFVLEPRVLPEDPFIVLQRNGSPVPLLIGSNREEVTDVSSFGDLTQPITADQYAADVHAQFDVFGPTVAGQVLALYPVSAYDAANWALVAVDSDFDLNICIVRNAARAALGPGQNPNFPQYAPVWRYLFTHRFENDTSLNALRAFHGAQLYFIFGNFNPVLGVNYTPNSAELTFSSTVMGYWTRFAANGDPNGPGALHWPRYSGDDLLLQLDVTPARLAGYHNPQCDFFTPILNTFCLKFPGLCTNP